MHIKNKLWKETMSQIYQYLCYYSTYMFLVKRHHFSLWGQMRILSVMLSCILVCGNKSPNHSCQHLLYWAERILPFIFLIQYLNISQLKVKTYRYTWNEKIHLSNHFKCLYLKSALHSVDSQEILFYLLTCKWNYHISKM